ncbi:hypothetical protein ABFX02_08G211600 [Erythranthe guttata]
MSERKNSHPGDKRPALPLKTRISLFVINTASDAARRRDGTVNRRLLHFFDNFSLRTPANPKPRNGVRTSDVAVDTSRDLWFRLFVPSHSESTGSDSQLLPLIVFFHGGGFVHLAPDFKAYDAVCRRFARKTPAVVVSVNYRLAPEHRYPAQYDDGFDVLRYIDDRRDILPENADLSRCFLAGDSAGANIAHHVTKRACESKFTHIKIIGLISIQPFFGGEDRTESELELAEVDAIVSIRKTDWMWEAFMPPGGGMDRDHEVINVSGPKAADISELDFPATMVVVAGFDSLKDWQKKYYEWLKKSGKEAYLVEYPKMIHAFYVFPELEESAQLISETKRFIEEQCSKVV